MTAGRVTPKDDLIITPEDGVREGFSEEDLLDQKYYDLQIKSLEGEIAKHKTDLENVTRELTRIGIPKERESKLAEKKEKLIQRERGEIQEKIKEIAILRFKRAGFREKSSQPKAFPEPEIEAFARAFQ